MMKRAPQKVLSFVACLGLVSILSGCACSSYSLFPNNPFKDRPVRNTIKSWFQGDACSTCNAPAGQTTFGNVAPLCEHCGAQPVYADGSQGVSLYGETSLNAPIGSPVYDSGIQNPAPIYDETNGEVYGSGVLNGTVAPPNF